MARSAIFILGALLSIASTFGNELPDFASPVGAFLSQDNLVTSVRHAIRHAPKTHFKGKVVGKCVKANGIGIYTGHFHGFSSSRKTIAKLKFHMKGGVVQPNVKIGYKLKATGKLRMITKNLGFPKITSKAKYGGKVHGYIKKKLVSGAFHGKIAVRSSATQPIFVKETGYFAYYYGKKLVIGTYVGTIDQNAIKYGVQGKIAGKKFFMKFSSSLNVLLLTGTMNPMMIKRNYGKVYITLGGKSIVQPFDMKPSDLHLGF